MSLRLPHLVPYHLFTIEDVEIVVDEHEPPHVMQANVSFELPPDQRPIEPPTTPKSEGRRPTMPPPPASPDPSEEEMRNIYIAPPDTYIQKLFAELRDTLLDAKKKEETVYFSKLHAIAKKYASSVEIYWPDLRKKDEISIDDILYGRKVERGEPLFIEAHFREGQRAFIIRVHKGWLMM